MFGNSRFPVDDNITCIYLGFVKSKLRGIQTGSVFQDCVTVWPEMAIKHLPWIRSEEVSLHVVPWYHLIDFVEISSSAQADLFLVSTMLWDNLWLK